MAATLVVSTRPFLIPHLHLTEDVGLVSAGTLASGPTIGAMLSLVAWESPSTRSVTGWP